MVASDQCPLPAKTHGYFEKAAVKPGLDRLRWLERWFGVIKVSVQFPVQSRFSLPVFQSYLPFPQYFFDRAPPISFAPLNNFWVPLTYRNVKRNQKKLKLCSISSCHECSGKGNPVKPGSLYCTI